MLRNIQKRITSSINPTILTTIKPIFLTIVPLIVIGDIVVIPNSSDIIIFSTLFFYIVCISLFRLKSRMTFFLALGILIIMYIEYLISGPSTNAEKAAVWLFVFLTVGILQQWREVKS